MSKRTNIRGGPYTPSRGRFAGVTFASRRQYENAVARERGFGNKSQRNIATKPITPIEVPSAAAFYTTKQGKAAKAYQLVRNEGLSLKKAADAVGTTSANVQRYYGESLEKVGGKFKAVPNDVAVFALNIVTDEGEVIAYVTGSRDRSLVGAHSNAIRFALSSRDRRLAQAKLKPFRGVTITSADGRTYELIADYDSIKNLARAGRITAAGPYEGASAYDTVAA